MAKAIVTMEGVYEVADQLVAAGTEPTILNVQDRIGGGSYTTVKRFLEQWRTERATARQEAVEIPAEIAGKGNDLLQSMWSAAMDIAGQEIERIRSTAAEEVAAAKASLTAAEAAIAQLEEAQETQTQTIAEQDRMIAQLREELAQARTALEVATARAGEQEQRLTDQARTIEQLREDLGQAHRQVDAASDRADRSMRELMELRVTHAQVAGELEGLKQHLQEQSAIITRLTSTSASSGE
jgi:chromosome segregation ATPase